MAVRLLLVDDHELIRVGIRMLLSTKPEWEICGEASNGRDAVTKVKQLNPDVVILDVSMAGMNGFEAAAEIRRIAPRTRIIFFSMHEVPATARQVGGDEFVCKSSSPRDLVAAIERALSRPPRERMASSSKPERANPAK